MYYVLGKERKNKSITWVYEYVHIVLIRTKNQIPFFKVFFPSISDCVSRYYVGTQITWDNFFPIPFGQKVHKILGLSRREYGSLQRERLVSFTRKSILRRAGSRANDNIGIVQSVLVFVRSFQVCVVLMKWQRHPRRATTTMAYIREKFSAFEQRALFVKNQKQRKLDPNARLGWC